MPGGDRKMAFVWRWSRGASLNGWRTSAVRREAVQRQAAGAAQRPYDRSCMTSFRRCPTLWQRERPITTANTLSLAQDALSEEGSSNSLEGSVSVAHRLLLDQLSFHTS